MDHMFKALNISDSKLDDTENGRAPIDLLSKDRKMTEALYILNELLIHEPNNNMLLDYKQNINEYIKQGLEDEEEEEEDEEEEEEDDEEDPEEEKQYSDDENEEKSSIESAPETSRR